MKMLWDDNYLYIGALLESDRQTTATFTERNSPIYQKDSDFEVFIDASGECHWYKELEINAINSFSSEDSKSTLGFTATSRRCTSRCTCFIRIAHIN